MSPAGEPGSPVTGGAVALARLGDWTRTSKWATVLASVGLDALAGLRSRRVAVEIAGGGQAAAAAEVAAAVDYVDSSYRTIRARSGLESVDGLRVIELGPGDHLGVALRLLADGAREVRAVDRFRFETGALERSVYAELARRLDPVQRARIAPLLERPDRTRLELLSGLAIEEADQHLEPGRADLVFSVAVLEHVVDPARALSAVYNLLAPGGISIHWVDFRDHGMFTGGGQHPLTFLTVPPSVYRRMIRHRGGPNRHLIDVYRRTVAELGFEHRILVSRLLGAEADYDPYPEELVPGTHYTAGDADLVARIRPRLARPYRNLSTTDLLSSGAFIWARRPPAAAQRAAPGRLKS